MAGAGIVAVLLACLAAASPAAAGDLEGRVERFIRERAPHAPTRIAVPALGDAADLPGAEGGELRLSAAAGEDYLGSVPVRLTVWHGGQAVHTAVVTARVESETVVWVADRDLPRGVEIRPQDLRRETLDRARLPQDALLEPDRLVGRHTTRGIREGAVWRAHWVQAPVLVARGAVVRLRLVRGPLRIEALGRAREDGRLGDPVRVQNLDSRREVVGRVSGEALVDVGL